MTTTEEMLELSHRLQAWRPDEMTLELMAIAETENLGPFCSECADWHSPHLPHSMTTEEEGK